MATINMRRGGTTGAPTRWANVETPYFVQIDVDLAEVAEAKGSALAASDVIEVLQVPADTVIMMAGVELTEAIEGASALTVDVDTSVNSQSYVSGFDAVAAVVGDQDVGTTAAVYGADDIVELSLSAVTGTITGGTLRVFALMLNIKEYGGGSIAQPGS